MKNFRWILLAGLLVTAPQLAHAQPPADGGTPGTTAATDAGGITNGAPATTTTTTTTVAPDAAAVPMDDAAMGEAEPMANTGGEPMLVALAGLSVAAMAFGLRRKVTA